jgi:hypothetical protein
MQASEIRSSRRLPAATASVLTSRAVIHGDNLPRLVKLKIYTSSKTKTLYEGGDGTTLASTMNAFPKPLDLKSHIIATNHNIDVDMIQ